MNKKINIKINGKNYKVNRDKTVLDVCKEHDIFIPTLCYHEQLEPYGSCFLCTVEIKGAKTKYTIACGTKVREGMEIQTDTREIWKQRKMALELLLSNHYADCSAPCYLTCPSNVDVQGYIAAIAEKNYTEAIRIIKEANPLPAVCGRVCTRPCEDECRRNLVDDKVGIDFLKRYASDRDIQSKHTYTPKTKPLNGKKIAIVGAGPSGLSAAYYLAIEGYEIDIFEQYEKAGGMLRYGIPSYRLPDDILDTEIKQITDLGPKIHYNKALGRDFTLESLKKEYDAVYVAIGAHECMFMGIEGEDAENSIGGIEFLRKVAANDIPDIGKQVVVVGGGNTAIDAARVSRRLGANVTMVYRRTIKEMPAHDTEIEDAQEEGIKIEFLTNPISVIKDQNGKVKEIKCIRMELAEADSSGRRRPIPIKDSEFTIKADTVIFAIGQKSDITCITNISNDIHDGIEFTSWKTIVADEKTFMTDVEGIFAGGDFRRGADTVIGGIADGKKAAWVMDKYIKTGEIIPYPEEFFSKKDNLKKQIQADYTHYEKKEKQLMPKLSADKRINNFNEVELGFSEQMAQKEADRCLECGCKAVFDCELKDNSYDYAIEQNRFYGEFKDIPVDSRAHYIIFEPNKCINCARCVRICKEVVGLSILGFENRGFKTIVKPPMDKSLLETECIFCGLCADACPTGAIITRPNTVKPGPFELKGKKTICTFCSFGCEIEVEKLGNKIISIKGYKESDINKFGNICKMGRFGFADFNNIENDNIQLQDNIDKFQKHLNNADAIIVGDMATLEEMYVLKQIADKIEKPLLPSRKSCNGIISDSNYDELEDADAILIAGISPYDDAPMIMPRIMNAKKNSAKLIYIGNKNYPIKRLVDYYEELSFENTAKFIDSINKYLNEKYDMSIDNSNFGKYIDNIEDFMIDNAKNIAEIINNKTTIVVTSYRAIDTGLVFSLNTLRRMGQFGWLLFGEGINHNGYTVINKQCSANIEIKNAIYYKAIPDGKGLYLNYKNSFDNDFIKLNIPYANEGHYINAENRIIKLNKIVNDMQYSDLELLTALYNKIMNENVKSDIFVNRIKELIGKENEFLHVEESKAFHISNANENVKSKSPLKLIKIP